MQELRDWAAVRGEKHPMEMPFYNGLHHWISFIMEILTFTIQTLPERILETQGHHDMGFFFWTYYTSLLMNAAEH